MKKKKTNYNKTLLDECLNRDAATLIGVGDDYKEEKKDEFIKIKRESIINFRCKCGQEYSKGFRAIYEKGGALCKTCTKEKTKVKVKATNLEIYGFEYVSQNNEIKAKTVSTNLKKYGVKNPLQNNEIKAKTKATNKSKLQDISLYYGKKKKPAGFWINENNKRLYCDWISSELNYKKIEDWYKVTGKDFVDNGAGGLLSIYIDSPIAILKDVYPEHNLIWEKEWLFNCTTRNFWDKHENQRLYCDWLSSELNYKKIEDWYNITQQIINNNKGSGLLDKYNGSPGALLKAVYPEHNSIWEKEWLFGMTSLNYWSNFENHKIFCVSLYQKLEYTCMEDWYKVTGKDILDAGGGGLLMKYYENSIKNLLKAVYSEHNSIWEKEWLFNCTTRNFWDKHENQRLYCDWLSTELNYKKIEDWYNISARIINNNKGSGLLDKYNSSPLALLKVVYPEYVWEKHKFHPQHSGISISWIKSIEDTLGISIQHAENGGEYKIPNSKFSADGYHEETNTIYEYHGCFWHGCPSCYPNREDLNPISKKTFEELYTSTLDRTNSLKTLGYNVIEIWGCEHKEENSHPDFDEEHDEEQIIIKGRNKRQKYEI